jgi:acetyl-CoA acetyltransferase
VDRFLAIDAFVRVAESRSFAEVARRMRVSRSVVTARIWQLDDPRVNPNGGAIALGHPLGASGARLVTTAINPLHRIRGHYALCTMCIGVGQGIALVLERV